MKDFSSYSDDDLLDLLESLDLELSCLIGTEEGVYRGDDVEKMYWMVMGEVNKRGIIVGEMVDDKEKGMIDSLREDKFEEKDNFCFGRDYEDDGYGDLPF